MFLQMFSQLAGRQAWGRLCSTQVPVKKTLSYVNVKSFKCVNSRVGLMHFEKKDSCNFFPFLLFFFFLHSGLKCLSLATSLRPLQPTLETGRGAVCFPNVFYHWWLQFSIEADCLVIAINQDYELCFRSGELNALLTVSLGIY